MSFHINDPNDFPKNFALLRLIERNSKDPTPRTTFNQPQSQIEEKTEEKPFKKEGLCPDHLRQFEIVCLDCNCRICTNCALFGAHKSHNIISEEQAIKEITIRAECLVDFLKII